MLSAEEIETVLTPGYELRGFELKGPGRRADKHLFAKVTRAALSMANLQDGGHVVIGIDDTDPAAMLPGLTDADLDSWLSYDDVSRAMAEYADPPLRIRVDRRDLSSGASVAVIQVFEFADIPHICSKDYPKVLRNGALYVRTRRLPETSEVPTSIEMREVVDLATRKSLRAYVKAAEDAGVTLTAHSTGRASYDAEAERAWRLSELTDKIRQSGHWQVAIQPVGFSPERVAYGELEPIVNGAVVRLRGWPVPYIDYRRPVLRGSDWVGQDIDARFVAQSEAWRFFTSGQFRHLRAVSADWRRGAEETPVPRGFTSVIEVWEVLYYLTEVFELAARLALTDAGAEVMTVNVELHDLAGRALIMGLRGRTEFVTPKAGPQEDSLTQKMTLSKDELIAKTRQHAVEMSQGFFGRFGWNPSLQQLTILQAQLASMS